jgi:predicted XRE-type DNA-binding protein
MKKRKMQDAEVEMGTDNVYADLGYADAGEMLIKRSSSLRLPKLSNGKALIRTKATALLEMPQPKLSNLLSGRFRGFSERRLMDCLTKLARDV